MHRGSNEDMDDDFWSDSPPCDFRLWSVKAGNRLLCVDEAGRHVQLQDGTWTSMTRLEHAAKWDVAKYGHVRSHDGNNIVYNWAMDDAVVHWLVPLARKQHLAGSNAQRVQHIGESSGSTQQHEAPSRTLVVTDASVGQLATARALDHGMARAASAEDDGTGAATAAVPVWNDVATGKPERAIFGATDARERLSVADAVIDGQEAKGAVTWRARFQQNLRKFAEGSAAASGGGFGGSLGHVDMDGFSRQSTPAPAIPAAVRRSSCHG